MKKDNVLTDANQETLEFIRKIKNDYLKNTFIEDSLMLKDTPTIRSIKKEVIDEYKNLLLMYIDDEINEYIKTAVKKNMQNIKYKKVYFEKTGSNIKYDKTEPMELENKKDLKLKDIKYKVLIHNKVTFIDNAKFEKETKEMAELNKEQPVKCIVCKCDVAKLIKNYELIENIKIANIIQDEDWDNLLILINFVGNEKEIVKEIAKGDK